MDLNDTELENMQQWFFYAGIADRSEDLQLALQKISIIAENMDKDFLLKYLHAAIKKAENDSVFVKKQMGDIVLPAKDKR